MNEIRKRHAPATIAIGHMNDEAKIGLEHLRFALPKLLLSPRPSTLRRAQCRIVGIGADRLFQRFTKGLDDMHVQFERPAEFQPLVPQHHLLLT